eukprot:PhM_4_TR15888/c3_g1_i1/m.16914
MTTMEGPTSKVPDQDSSQDGFVDLAVDLNVGGRESATGERASLMSDRHMSAYMSDGENKEITNLRTQIEAYKDLTMAAVLLDVCNIPSVLRAIDELVARGNQQTLVSALLRDSDWCLTQLRTYLGPEHAVYREDPVDTMQRETANMLSYHSQCNLPGVNALEKEMEFGVSSANCRSVCQEATVALLTAGLEKLPKQHKIRSMMSRGNGTAVCFAGIAVMCLVGLATRAPDVAPTVGFLCCFVLYTVFAIMATFRRLEKYAALSGMVLSALTPIALVAFDASPIYSAAVVPLVSILTVVWAPDVPVVQWFIPTLWVLCAAAALVLDFHVLTLLALVELPLLVAVLHVTATVVMDVVGRSYAEHCRLIKSDLICSSDTFFTIKLNDRMSCGSKPQGISSTPPSLMNSMMDQERRLRDVRLPSVTVVDPGNEDEDETSTVSSSESVVNANDVKVATAGGPTSPSGKAFFGNHESTQFAHIHGEREGLEYLMSMDAIQAHLAIVGVAKDGTVVSWNATMSHHTGYTDHDAVGKKLSAFLTGDASMDDFIKNEHFVMAHTVTFARKGKMSGVPIRMCCTPMYMTGSAGRPDRGAKSVGVVLAGAIVEDNSRRQNTGQWLTTQIQNQIVQVTESVKSDNKETASVCIKNLESLVLRLRHVLCDEGESAMLELDVTVFTSKLRSENNLKAEQLKVDPGVPDMVQMDSAAIFSIEQFTTSIVSRARTHGSPPEITIKMRVEVGMSYVQFLMRDNGPALSRKRLAAMFDGGKDSDMLHAAQRVQRAGGNFTMKSKKGVGSTVIIELPYIEVEGAANNKADGVALVVPKEEKVLIPFSTLMLEQTDVYRNALCHILWKRRHAIQQAYRVPQAISLLDQVEPEIVIVSVSSRSVRRQVHDLITAAHNRSGSTKFVFTAENLTDEIVTKAKAAGIEVVRTPYTAAEVNAVMASVEESIMAVRREVEVRKNITRVLSEKNNCPWNKGRELGSGAAGTVYEAEFELTGGVMAVKIVPIQGLADADIIPHLQEIELLSQLQHDNIINYFYCTRTETELQVFMEFATEGCLQKLIKDDPLEPSLAAAFMKDVLRGMEYLHSHDVVHRDIKSANILLSSGYIAKVADFGCATQIDKDQGGIAGTPSFMAPELLDGHKATQAADVWALGCLLWEIMSGGLPFPEFRGLVPLIGFLGAPETTEQMVWNRVPNLNCPQANDFIRLCLRLDPAMRPTCSQLLEHEFITLSKKEFQFDEPSETGSERSLVSASGSFSMAVPGSFTSTDGRRRSNNARLVRSRSNQAPSLSEHALKQHVVEEQRKKNVSSFFDDSDSDNDSIASDLSVNTVNWATDR